MDQLREEQGWLITGSLAVLAVIAVGFGLSYTSGVLVPFTLAIFIASVVSPLVDYQVVHLRFPRTVAVIVTLLVVIIVMFGFGLLILHAIQNVVRSIGEYTKDIIQMIHDVLQRLESWNVQFDGNELLDKMKGEAPRLATTIVGNTTSLLSKGVLIFIFVGFLMSGRDPHLVRRGVYADIDKQIRRYIGTKFVISSVTGILVWICLRLFQLEFASLFGLLAFVLNFIPSVGSVIATLLPLPTAVAQFSDNPLLIFAVVAVPGAIQMTIGNVIEPKLMGDGLKLHPVTILLSLTVWGLLWGPIGMLLAAPITAVIRIVLDQFEITKPASRLLSGQLPGAASSPSDSH